MTGASANNASTASAAPSSSSSSMPQTPSGTGPCVQTKQAKQIAWKSFYALGEHLADYLIDNGTTTTDLFVDPGYQPQVKALYDFVVPANTFVANGYGPHLHTILPQLTPQYLSSFTPNAIAEVLRQWIKSVTMFNSTQVNQVVQIAANFDPNQRIRDMKTLLEQQNTSTQSFFAHILQLCNILWANAAKTKATKALLAAKLAPIIFPVEQVSMECQVKIKNVNRLFEDMIVQATTVAQNGFNVLATDNY